MRLDDPNLPQLRIIAEAVGPLREKLVFVGGSTAGLLLTDLAAESVRATKDVDAIVEADTLVQFYGIENELGTLGFVRDSGSDVICRWIHRDSGVLFDLMPVQPLLGFSNPWYGEVVRSAMWVTLDKDLVIRVVSPPAFVATKLEAYESRGNGDVLASHDLEDILNVVDGHPALIEELQAAPAAMRSAIALTLNKLLSNSTFADGLPGMISDSSRASIVWDRLLAMAATATSE